MQFLYATIHDIHYQLTCAYIRNWLKINAIIILISVLVVCASFSLLGNQSESIRRKVNTITRSPVHVVHSTTSDYILKG